MVTFECSKCKSLCFSEKPVTTIAYNHLVNGDYIPYLVQYICRNCFEGKKIDARNWGLPTRERNTR